MLMDIYCEFINENIESHTESSLKIEDAYGAFKVWYKESYSGLKCPSRKELKCYMDKKYGNYVSRGKRVGWFGIRIIPNNIEEDYVKLDDSELNL